MADEVRGKELQEVIPTGDENPSALRWYELVPAPQPVFHVQNARVGVDGYSGYPVVDLAIPMVSGTYDIAIRDSDGYTKTITDVWPMTGSFYNFTNNQGRRELVITETTVYFSYYYGAWRDIYCDILTHVEDECILTEDTAVDPNKTYFKEKVMSFDQVTPVSGDNPAQNGWYEVEENWFVLTSDTTVVSGKAYYEYHTTATTGNGDIAKFKPKIQAFEEASVGAKVKDALVDAIAYCNTLHSIRFGMEAKN